MTSSYPVTEAINYFGPPIRRGEKLFIETWPSHKYVILYGQSKWIKLHNVPGSEDTSLVQSGQFAKPQIDRGGTRVYFSKANSDDRSR